MSPLRVQVAHAPPFPQLRHLEASEVSLSHVVSVLGGVKCRQGVVQALLGSPYSSLGPCGALSIHLYLVFGKILGKRIWHESGDLITGSQIIGPVVFLRVCVCALVELCVYRYMI